LTTNSATIARSGVLDSTVVDHLVYASPDLDAGIATIEALTGQSAVSGGSHAGMGTRNALLRLGPSSYLEIIAPDPAQADYRCPRPFRIDELDAPRLVTWAARSDDVGRLATLELPQGQSPGAALAGSRQKPDGAVLAWQFTDPQTEVAAGVIPFFIDWGDTPHPAARLPGGTSLLSLRGEHPNPDFVRECCRVLGIDMSLSVADTPALVAILATPQGCIELR